MCSHSRSYATRTESWAQRYHRRLNMPGRCSVHGLVLRSGLSTRITRRTGAFKVRGGLVYLDRLTRERPDVPGLISATRGNHGQSIAFAGRRHGRRVTIVVPHGNSAEKNAAMRALGAELVEHGVDFQAAREEAERRAAAGGLEMVPSFHRDLVRGVATYALELLNAVPDLATLYVPIGMGSGICGCILVRDLLGLATEIVGVQSI